jgi:group II intron reverse transcriptase/maturase
VDFIGFSYGFRPGRNPHRALTALFKALMTQPINWVLDADIRRFFDSVDHEWLMRMLAHRIADPRVLRLIRGWLKAGVMESGEWHEVVEGTPQGAGISPLLANIFLHYVLDVWVHHWRQRHAKGRVIIVRYADDFVMGFQHETDAREMLAALKERLVRFGLALHEDKMRLIEFGRFAARNRAARRQPRPASFVFLGFTHYCGNSRKGSWSNARPRASAYRASSRTCARRHGSGCTSLSKRNRRGFHACSKATTAISAWAATGAP